MPERRIDGIGKADAATWSGISLPKGSSNMLRILSGQLTGMKPGEVMNALVDKNADGSFRVKLKGETFTFKGLPDSLAGREVSFIAQRATGKGSNKIELFWIGPARSGKTGPAGLPQGGGVQRSGTTVNLLSSLPSVIKTGTTVQARIDNIANGKMALSFTTPDPKMAGGTITHQLQAEALAGLRQGQQIGIRIRTDAGNMAKLEISPQQQSTQSQHVSATKTETATFKLAAGETAAALVQKRLPNGNVQLNLLGTTVEAPAPKSVRAGDLLMLRTGKSAGEFQLVSVQKNIAEKAMASLKANLPAASAALDRNMTAIRNLTARLPDGALPEMENWLRTVEAGPKQPLTGQRLAQMIRDGGVALEPKLLAAAQKAAGGNVAVGNDLKALLLQLADAQGSTIRNVEIVRALAEQGQQGAKRIEATQALNVLAAMQGDAMRIELPMLVNGQPVNVQLSVRQQEGYSSNEQNQGADTDASYNVLFALELSGLGNMRVDANITEQSVHARIHNGSTEASNFVQEHIDRLETRLRNLGFREVYLLSTQSEPEQEKQIRFEQLANMTPASTHLLDVMA